MSKVLCFTSFTFSYLNRARTLAWSFKKFNPDIIFVALITDKCPEGFELKVENEYFDAIVWACDLCISDFESWVFEHDIVEACTAVKGPALQFFIENYDPEKIIYLDPDIAVFSSFDFVVDELDDYDILLTPHQLEYEDYDDNRAICDNEIGSLKYGIYNFGFFAIRCDGSGLDFANWWSARLLKYCRNDIPNGLFTDQRWGDHIPAFFNHVKIIKDPGCNVASWNLSKRKIEIKTDGQILVNGSNLKFYHFTKLGSIGEAMTSRYAGDNVEVYELWEWYKRQVFGRFNEDGIPDGWWFYNYYINGELISYDARSVYRCRKDLKDCFKKPYSTLEYYQWYKKNHSEPCFQS